ncbi:MAG: recombinase family protein, partial [Bacillota bacterium]
GWGPEAGEGGRAGRDEPPGTVARIRELYRQGKSHWTIAKQLNEEGCRTRRGGKFYHQTVRQILEDRRYRDLAVDRKVNTHTP